MCGRVGKVMGGGRTKTEKRNMKVSEARPLLEEAESDRLINQDTVSNRMLTECLTVTVPTLDMFN